MKRAVYSFLLIFLLSCGSNPSSSRNRIKLQFRDSIIEDYYLLSVREHSLVITPFTTDYSSIDELIAHAEVIPFEKVEHLYKNSSASSEDELWAGGTGLALTGCYELIPHIFYGGSGDGHPSPYNFGIPIGGFAAGLVIGVLANNAYSERFLDSKEHLELVKYRAYYKDGEEPPELQKIK
jgi:hypothetical protein